MSDAIAFLFPGQGRSSEALPPPSRRVDQLLELAEQSGLALRTWIEDQRADLLRQTENAQPALFIDSIGREAALRAHGISPAAVAGHSLGEYAALVSSGVLDVCDGLAAVIERGRAMRGVEGAMAAILKLDAGTVEALCDQVGRGVCVANYNAPTQIVISGERPAVEELSRLATAAGGRSLALPVSGPFHSPLMAAAERALEPLLRTLPFAAPVVPVVSGVTAAIQRDPEELRKILCSQITSPVRWVGVVRRLEELGVAIAVEVGSGDVLTRLGHRMETSIRFMTYEEAIDERP